ncbi:FAR1 DNA-binding domain protein [Medicago truncatula]|uniref:FAR1 DNA-binding domain protein n=1 Tax=Medicago truncatula TaxID=3880 RepID=G7ID14_MEDTR|nr:FAR1 DNA-binding domain protein [Medicago truncatula]
MPALFSDMVVPVDAPNVDPHEIQPPNVLPLILLEDVHDYGNAISENPPPPPQKLEISLGGSKAEDAPPPIPPVVPPPIVAVCINQREHFTTKHKFATRNDLLKWVGEKARKLGFSIVIGKSDNSGNGRSAFVTLICERGGSYTEYKRKSRRQIVGSVKRECPFRLRGYLLAGGEWSLKVGDGKHNHDMTDVLKGHKTVGHLNPNERVHLEEMVDSNVPPRQMFTNLKKMNRTTSTTIKHVYNASYRYRRSIRDTRNGMQHLLKSLVDNGYVYHCRKYLDSEVVSDVFWAHPDSIKLFNKFSMALERWREMLHSKDLYPKVVVTDRDNALINDVENVFPKATNMLLTDLKGKNGQAIKPASVVKTVMAAWTDIVDSDTEEAYIDNWTRFKTILDLVKEKFVRFWVDKNLHMGNTTTNKVESALARLKKYLSSSMGNLSTNWQSVNNMLELQHTTIHASFQTSIIMLEHRFKGKLLWSHLIRRISREALHHLVVEYNKALEIGTDKSKCGCLSLITYGLLCACMIGLKIKNGTALRLDEIHTH